MFEILESEWLAKDVRRFRIRAPLVARHHRPGQFVIVRLGSLSERIPLTIANAEAAGGAIELIVKAVGSSTIALCERSAGEMIADIVGPLGRPTEIERLGYVVVVGGGVGTAVIYPLAKALSAVGNRVTALIGGRTREQVILERELAGVVDTVFACTDDGSYGFHGTVADLLAQMLDDSEPVRDRNLASAFGAVYAAGPVSMMRAIANLTRPMNIKTIVSLNPIMVDGTGMCGGCRVTVGGQMRFACVDGPEFDGHAVDFDELADRLSTYREDEAKSLARQSETCKLGQDER